jgi:hypothetical protein
MKSFKTWAYLINAEHEFRNLFRLLGFSEWEADLKAFVSAGKLAKHMRKYRTMWNTCHEQREG